MKKQLLTSLFAFLLVFSLCMGCSKAETGDKTTASDYVVNFAQLTQRAGNFLVARQDNEHFQWADLKGKTVLGGRKGGVHILM